MIRLLLHTTWVGVAVPDDCGMLNCRLTARLRINFERIGNLKCQYNGKHVVNFSTKSSKSFDLPFAEDVLVETATHQVIGVLSYVRVEDTPSSPP